MSIEKQFTWDVLKIAYEVHSSLGPGLLESAYRECLFYELRNTSFHVEKELPLPIVYKEIKLDHGYRLDLVVEKKLTIEIKTVETLAPVHFHQVLTYLKFGNYPLGLLINFHVVHLKEGIKRVVNEYSKKNPRRASA